MGNTAPQVKAAGGGAQRDPLLYLQHDLPKYIKKNELGTGRFMKSFLCNELGTGSSAIVKVYLRHENEPPEEVERAKEGVDEINGKLSYVDHPNVLAYQRAIVGQPMRGRVGNAGYVVRQHFYTSLNDRLSTRPFLSIIEKKWIVYQLFQAVVQCHSMDVCHGDIKTENVMATSWSWIVLTDFASFKPTYLPEDDPTDFNHYFASSTSHRCYLAPERFYSSLADAETEASFKGLDPKDPKEPKVDKAPGRRRVGKLQKSMDIFSLGCIIAEVFLGAAVLDLPMLLQYRSSKGDQEALLSKLDKIDSEAVGPELKNLVKNMLQLDPANRKEARDYLRRCETVVGESGSTWFPASFTAFLYRFMAVLQREVTSADERVLFVCRHYLSVMRHCCGFLDTDGAAYFAHFAPPDLALPGSDLGLPDEAPPSAALAKPPPQPSADGDVEALAFQTRLLLEELEGTRGSAALPQALPPPRPAQPPTLPTENSLIVVAQLVCSSIRHVREPQSKVLALQLLGRFALHLDDEARLQRVLPYAMAMLDDGVAAVRATAVRITRDTLALVRRFPASDSDIFPKYILPTLQKVPTDPDELVRIAFAESIAGLAETSRRFLETAQGLAEDAPKDKTEEKLEHLQATISKWLHDLVGDMDSRLGGAAPARSNLVKRALLRDITRLCIFFGASDTERKVLPLIITMINDRDWELRYAFCAQIPALGAFLGRTVVENFIMPLLHPLIVDKEELVVSRALRCLATLAELGLLRRETLLERAEYAAPLLLHPGSWVRQGAVLLVTAAARRLGPPDAQALLYPKIAGFMALDLTDFEDGASLSPDDIAGAALPPLSRGGFQAELLRIANDLRKGPSGAGSPVTAATSGAVGDGAEVIDASEREVLVRMTGYMKAAASNLTDKMQNGGERAAPAPPRPARGEPRRGRAQRDVGAGEMSRLQLHADLLSNAPVSLFVPRSSTPAALGGRDELLALRKAFLAELASRPGDRAITVWALPPDLRDPAKLRALYGVATNARDAQRLARSQDDEDGERRVRDDRADRVDEALPLAAARRRGTALGATSEGTDAATLLRRIVALGIPPLPPDLGTFRGGDAPPAPSGPASAAASAASAGGTGSAATAVPSKNKEWRPKVGGVLVQTLMEHVPKDEHGGFRQGPMFAKEHSGAVNRLAVSPDHTFFVSASSDGHSRVWATAQLETTVNPRAAAVYAQQSGRILDACVVEGSRSVCTASDAGDVHVWRVDLLGKLRGTAEVRRVPTLEEGPVLAVAQFNTESACLLVYGTQRGFIHCWDLRSEEETWALRVPPELGFLTTLAIGSGAEKSWICAGTSRGFLAVWDIRFQVMVRLWRHSSYGPIHRIATCARLPEDPEGAPAQPLAFVAAGSSELAVWNLFTGGLCRRCFRALAPHEGIPAPSLPTLDPVALPPHPSMPIFPISQIKHLYQTRPEPGHAVNAIMGRISTNGNSYVITGSTDRHIRFWDMATPTKCFTLSGLEPGQSRPAYDSIAVSSSPDNALFVCYDADVPARENMAPSQMPFREQRGLVVPSASHNDSILDLKGIDLPTKMMISSSRDGAVKCWK